MSNSQTALQQPVLAVDVGSTKVAALIARPGPDGWRILGVGLAPSTGVRKGIVVDLAAAGRAVSSAVTRAEQMANVQLTTAWLTVGGNHLGLVPGWAEHQGAMARVEAPLAQRLENEARAIHLQSDRQALSWHRQGWAVDGTWGVHDPVGLIATDLAVQGHLVTAGQGAIGNLKEVLAGAGLTAAGLLSVPEAVGELLTAEERAGSLVLDLGGQTTHAALYQGGALVHLMCLPVGGDHLTHDLALALNLPLAAAEQLKQQQGIASPGFARDTSFTVTFPGGTRVLSEVQVAAVLESRLREMLALVVHDMRTHGKGLELPAQIVITGGGAGLGALVYYLNQLLGLPVRVGRPPAWMQQGGVDDPALAAIAGLLIHATAVQPSAKPAVDSAPLWQRMQKVLRSVARRK